MMTVGSIKFLIILILMGLPLISLKAQDVVPDEKKIEKITWLMGDWEGVGYRSRSQNAKPVKANFGLSFEKDSLRITILSDGMTIFREYFDPTSEYQHVKMNGTEITMYVFGEEKWDTRELKILQLASGSINVSLLHNRIQTDRPGRLLFNAAFIKK